MGTLKDYFEQTGREMSNRSLFVRTNGLLMPGTKPKLQTQQQ